VPLTRRSSVWIVTPGEPHPFFIGMALHCEGSYEDVLGLLSDGLAEPVKAFETRTQDFFCVSVWMVGLLIQATVGSLGGVGRRPQNRRGLAA